MDKWLRVIKDYTTLFLAVFSAYIYICTYQYEKAFLKEFEIADEYLALDLNTILKDATYVITVIVVILFLYQTLLRPFRWLIRRSQTHEQITRIVMRLITALALAQLFLAIPFNILMHVFLSLVTLFILFVFYTLISAWRAKKREIHEERTPTELAKATDGTLNGFDAYYYILFILAMPLFICEFLGEGEAYRKKEFDVIHDSINYVVIRKYGEQLVCKDLDNNNLPGIKTVIFKLSVTKPLIVTHQTLGAISSTNMVLNPSLPKKKQKIIGMHR